MSKRTISDDVKKEYMEWLLTPPTERDPLTKAEMGEQLGVAQSTLWHWEKSPEFQTELRQLKSKWGVKFHAEILGRLMDVVANGTDTAAIQAAKVLLPHIDTGPQVVKEDDLTEEHLTAIRKALQEDGWQVVDRP